MREYELELEILRLKAKVAELGLKGAMAESVSAEYRKALEFAYTHLISMDGYSLVSGARSHMKETLDLFNTEKGK